MDFAKPQIKFAERIDNRDRQKAICELLMYVCKRMLTVVVVGIAAPFLCVQSGKLLQFQEPPEELLSFFRLLHS